MKESLNLKVYLNSTQKRLMSPLLTANILNIIFILIFYETNSGLIRSYSLWLRAASFGSTLVLTSMKSIGQTVSCRNYPQVEVYPFALVRPIWNFISYSTSKCLHNCFMILQNSSTVKYTIMPCPFPKIHFPGSYVALSLLSTSARIFNKIKGTQQETRFCFVMTQNPLTEVSQTVEL